MKNKLVLCFNWLIVPRYLIIRMQIFQKLKDKAILAISTSNKVDLTPNNNFLYPDDPILEQHEQCCKKKLKPPGVKEKAQSAKCL